ncbi:unnamed protein product [Lupinus luteus]|uniref:Uncharacterized protein n=1 Tax=Lupinus luteus TaxID=3873 RepID=A0AAV1XMU8_LUPLU
MLVPDASVSNMNGFENFGRANTGARVIANFNVSKAEVAEESQLKLSFLSRLVNTKAMDAYPLINLR